MIDADRVRAQIDEEIQRYYQLLAANEDLRSLSGLDATDLLRSAIEERLAKILDRVFRLLGIIYPLKAIDLIHSNLKSNVANTRANAVEVLDNVLDTTLKRKLLPLLEDGAVETVLEHGKELFNFERHEAKAWVGKFLASDEPWLAVVSIYVIGELGMTELADDVAAYLSHGDPVARETALRTLSLLLPPEEMRSRGHTLNDDNDAHVRLFSKQLLAEPLTRPAVGAAAPA